MCGYSLSLLYSASGHGAPECSLCSHVFLTGSPSSSPSGSASCGGDGQDPSPPGLGVTVLPCWAIILQDHGQQCNWGWGHSPEVLSLPTASYLFLILRTLGYRSCDSLVFSSPLEFAYYACPFVCLHTGGAVHLFGKSPWCAT